MPNDLIREWPGEFLVRAAGDPSERVIEGIAVPFGQVVAVRDSADGPVYRETIARGATDGLDPVSVLLDYLTDPPAPYNTHQGSRLAGRGVESETTETGLRMGFRVARTSAGDELLELAREGILTDMSVMFAPRTHRRRDDGVLERTAIDIHRVTIVPKGAYSGAQITAVRAASETDEPPAPPTRLVVPPTPTLIRSDADWDALLERIR
jgi:HK97 family phage prohead protease